MENLISILIFAFVGVFGLLVIGIILARLYKRASKEISFVRTGMGGQAVIMDGGALVLPVLHQTIDVNMATIRLAIRRDNDEALITKDRMRVDVLCEFYVRVQPSIESIASAAQTLGQKTLHPDELKELIEGKLVDALRAIAASMDMTDLHEQRADFVQKVQLAVDEDLRKNGLELESVSLTGLDQTSREFFDEDNAFDAEGLTRLTEQIEERKKQRNAVEQDTLVAIQEKNLEAKRKTLEFDRETEYATLDQQREIAARRAEQESQIASEQANRRQQSEEARITSDQNIAQAEIASQQALERKRIAKDQDIEIAEQDKAIAVSEKSKHESEARAQADEARAKAVQAEEKVKTARDEEIANRSKTIELIEASKQAERDAIAIKVTADAEKQAASDRADALRENAKAEADAEIMRAEAAKTRYEVDAEGERAINEAKNLLSTDQIAMQIKLRLMEALPAIIEQSVKPMESIEGIKIVQVGGLNGSSGSHEDANGSSSLADSLVNSALKYRAQQPLLDSVLNEIGIKGGDINGLTAPMTDMITQNTPTTEVTKTDKDLSDKKTPPAKSVKKTSTPVPNGHTAD